MVHAPSGARLLADDIIVLNKTYSWTYSGVARRSRFARAACALACRCTRRACHCTYVTPLSLRVCTPCISRSYLSATLCQLHYGTACFCVARGTFFASRIGYSSISSLRAGCWRAFLGGRCARFNSKRALYWRAQHFKRASQRALLSLFSIPAVPELYFLADATLMERAGTGIRKKAGLDDVTAWRNYYPPRIIKYISLTACLPDMPWDFVGTFWCPDPPSGMGHAAWWHAFSSSTSLSTYHRHGIVTCAWWLSPHLVSKPWHLFLVGGLFPGSAAHISISETCYLGLHVLT